MATKTRAVRPLPLYVEVLGWLALLSTVALVSPGVTREASGEPGASASAADGPSCSGAEASAERLAQELEKQVAQLRAQAEAQGDPGGGEVVVLNNSGFNYRPTPPAPNPNEQAPAPR
jgi:hypothetical protein